MLKCFDRRVSLTFRRALLSSCGIVVASSLSTAVLAQGAPAPAAVTTAPAAPAAPDRRHGCSPGR